ncbi:MAG: putative DNA binding domain-containing protein [Oscillospiraceae bacterium]|nr:putative DNA binding domain-containing protein [Oscillospiraceae bacterium]
MTDYKVALEDGKPRSWLKSVSAFANSHGGYILFGVTNDTHIAIGLEDPQGDASKIAELISARISPAPRYELSPFPSDDGTKQCIKLSIQNGPSYPYYFVNERTREAYIRHGDRSELASDSELNNLILKGENKTYDSLPSSRKYSDVSFTLLGATYKKETRDDLILPRDLLSMCMLTEDNQVTNAGLLLCDQGYLPQSKIVCTRWKGTEKGSVEGDALDDKEFRDASLISLLEYAEAFIRNNSKNPWTIRGMRREEKSDYPFKAVREVLVNAMIHRDYQIVGSEIHVDMFDDRLEIMSPGGMLNGGRIQEMDLRHIPSMRRNEIISDIFGRLHYMDRRGSGIGRILNSYAEFAQKPDFFSTEYYFLVVLPNRSVADPAQVTIDFAKTQSEFEITQSRAEITQSRAEITQSVAMKTPLVAGNDGFVQDWELIYFRDVFLKEHGKTFRTRTQERILTLFTRYRYTYNFNRRNVADLFKITENGASGFIAKCIDSGIIKRIKVDEYCFMSEKE